MVFLGCRGVRAGGIHGKSNKETFAATRTLSRFGSMRHHVLAAGMTRTGCASTLSSPQHYIKRNPPGWVLALSLSRHFAPNFHIQLLF